MPIDATIQMDPMECGYGLPADTACVGNDDPATTATTVSKMVSSPATSKDVQAHNSGYYDGP